MVVKRNRRRIVTFIIVFGACMAFVRGAPGVEEMKPSAGGSSFPSILSMVKITAPVTFCDERVPLSDPDVAEGIEKEMLLAIWNRPQVLLWIKRSGRYFPIIEKILREKNLPDDLKYVAVIESALRPHIGSSRNALGFWQFLRSTGLKYGLRIDNEIDERRNIFTATEAAAEYLIRLYKEFESWSLAAAAYNMGEYQLRACIEEQQTDNYYDLYLPLETQRHILKIIAAKLIMSNPEKYGFNITREDMYPPLAFDRTILNGKTKIPVVVIAKAANTTYKKIKDLNPQIRGNYLAEGKNIVLIPKGSEKGFLSGVKTGYMKWAAHGGLDETAQKIEYTVKRGDYLSGVAGRFGVPLYMLLKWNGLTMKSVIHPGDRLIIYKDPLENPK